MSEPLVPSRRLIEAAGWTVAGFGAVHLAVAPTDVLAAWSRIRADGWWNTVSLAEPVTLEQAARSDAFWRTLGSFGAPMVALGWSVVAASRRGRRVPRAIGWILLVWGVPLVVVLPASPGWVVPAVGTLIVAADRPAAPPPVTATEAGAGR